MKWPDDDDPIWMPIAVLAAMVLLASTIAVFAIMGWDL